MVRTGEAAFLRVREAAVVLGISNSAAYELANAWLATERPDRAAGGSHGPPHPDPPGGDRPAGRRRQRQRPRHRPRRLSRRHLSWSCLTAIEEPRLLVSAAQPDTAPAAARPGLGDPGRGRSGRGRRRRPAGGPHLGPPGRRTSRGRPRHRRWGAAGPSRPWARSSRTRAGAGGPLRPVGLRARPGQPGSPSSDQVRSATRWKRHRGDAVSVRRCWCQSGRHAGRQTADPVDEPHTDGPTFRRPLCSARGRRRSTSGRRRRDGAGGCLPGGVASVCAWLGCWGGGVDGWWG